MHLILIFFVLIIHVKCAPPSILFEHKFKTDSGSSIQTRLYIFESLYKIEIFFDRECKPYDFEKITDGSNQLSQLLDRLKLGPDEIYVQLEGTSLHTEVARSEKCNNYHAYFKLPVTGYYRLKVFRVRTDYNSIAENNDAFPRIKYEVFCDELLPLKLKKTTAACSFNRGHWIFQKDKGDMFFDTPLYLPQERGDISLYTYVRTDTRTYPGTKHNCSQELNTYEWKMQACEDDTKHALLEISKKHAAKMIQERNFLFIGDSHMRGLADTFLSWSCDVKDDSHFHQVGSDVNQTIKLNNGNKFFLSVNQ